MTAPPRAARAPTFGRGLPGSRTNMMQKADGLRAAQAMLHLDNARAPAASVSARGANVNMAALNDGAWDRQTRAVRVNDYTSRRAHLEGTDVVTGVEKNLDASGSDPRAGRTSRNFVL